MRYRESSLLALKLILTRFVLMSLPIVDVLLLGVVDFVAVGTFSVASAIVQIGVVASGTFFVGFYSTEAFKGKEEFNLNHPFSLAIVLGLIFSGLGGIFGGFVLTSQLGHLVLVGSIGIFPLFLFGYATARFETSSRANTVFWLGVFSAFLNLVFDLLLIYLMENPASAVMWSSTIIRIIAAIYALALLREPKILSIKHLLSASSKFIFFRGVPEVVTRSLFITLMAFALLLFKVRVSEVEMSILGITFNYMNVLLVFSMSITLAASTGVSVWFSKNAGKFLKFGTIGILACGVLFALVAACIFCYMEGRQFSWFWIVLCGVKAATIDGLSNHLVMFLRKQGIYKYPPYIRLILFPVLFFGIFLISEITALHFTLLILGGNLFALAILVTILVFNWPATKLPNLSP